MKKSLLILFLTLSTSFGNYISSGIGSSKAEAYLNAMSAAPSGDHWVLKKISYAPSSGCRYTCNVVWEQK
jgi:hypothetical protein